MTATDRLDDDFPHGTRLGFEKGCRGRCPAGDEHGLSCKRAKMLAAGDYQYQKLFRRGATPAEIAEHFGLVPEVHAAPKTDPAPGATESVTNEDSDDQPAPTAQPDGFEVFTKQHARTELPEGVTRAEIRVWARANGFRVNDRGALPKAVIEAYTTREDSSTVEPETVEVIPDDAPALPAVLDRLASDGAVTVLTGSANIVGELTVTDSTPADGGLLDALSQLLALGADPNVWIHRAVILAAANVTEELVRWLADVASHGILAVEDAAALRDLGIPIQERESTALGLVLQKWATEQHRADIATLELERAERTLRIDDQDIARLLTESTRMHQEIRSLRAQLAEKRPRRRGRAS